MVRQVQVVAILMIVNGALVSVMGLIYSFMGPAMFAMMAAAPPPPGGGGPGNVEAGIISAIYIAIGLPILAAGVLNIIAGIRSLKLRNRVLGIVALFCNILPLFTCYCLPTSLGVMIYGLIVFFQTDVAHAFAEVAAGAPPELFLRGVPPDEFEEEDWQRRPAAAPQPPPRQGDNIQLGPDAGLRRPPDEE